MKIKYNSGEPCKHKGCLNHISHPCEGCGRIGGKGNVYFYDDLSEENNIYILPTQDKPVKIVYEGLPCPILLQLGTTYRCKYAKSSIEDLNYNIACVEKKLMLDKSV